jgi:integrase
MARRTRGTGEVFQENGGWSIRWRENGRRRYRGGFASKMQAERFLARRRGELAIRSSGLPPDPKTVPTLGELAPDWLERRELTHKAAAEDGYRWHKHLAPWFGARRPAEVDVARIRTFVEAKLQEGLESGTVRVLVSILSSLYADLIERELAGVNPARGLPRTLARLLRPSHDPRTTPFVEKLADVRRLFLAIEPEELRVAFALGAFAGLRPGESFALKWPQVDLEGRRIHVRESVTGSTKDKDSRMVPVLDALLPVLKAWKLKSGGEGLVCPPLRCDGEKVDKGTRIAALHAAAKACGLPAILEWEKAWYQATRHTFASHWVMAGRSIEELKEILGHYSVVMTERYAHLRPDLFAPGAHQALAIDLGPGGGELRRLENGQSTASKPGTRRATSRKQ